MSKKIIVFSIIGLTLLVAAVGLFVYSGRSIKWAIDNNHTGLLDKFLWVGAPVNADFGAYINPLAHAVSVRNTSAIPVLVKHGATVNTYPFRDLSLLAWAYSVAEGPEAGEALLKAGANVGFLAVPTSGKTVLMYLLSYETLDIRKIRSVLSYGPDLTIRDAKGLSSIDYILKREVDLRMLGLRDEEWQESEIELGSIRRR